MATQMRKPAPPSGVVTGKPLIESDRVDGTTVYDPQGEKIGVIRRMMIDKMSGRVAYTVMAFDTFLGLGGRQFALPWSKLTYDTSLGGFRTNITETQLRDSPDIDYSDRKREQELHDYWNVPYYWGM
ncbi:PRC-barrel domain-containing protein [Terrarubrum flagellatum]|uniref:PRC-barrel domain-containing protein n=1 Tax=Terrirubrum flagellatum TaxID=2895980 RepID=UPI003144DAC6